MRKVDPVERQLLLQGILLKYGYDFRQYSENSLNRRLDAILVRCSLETTLDLLKPVLESRAFFLDILPMFTVGTTEFFRDPDFYSSLRQAVFPVLSTYPSLNIWVAGCSTGEELYSLAVLLKEAGLLKRSTIFATDINSDSLARAKAGIYDLSAMQIFSKNYVAAGGSQSPSEYYTADYGLVRIDAGLRENVNFFEHNLATDGVFKEMHLVLCRNVMIYFNKELQNRVLNLFLESLGHRSFLGIGSKESLRFSDVSPRFETIDARMNIYRRRAEARTGGL